MSLTCLYIPRFVSAWIRKERRSLPASDATPEVFCITARFKKNALFAAAISIGSLDTSALRAYILKVFPVAINPCRIAKACLSSKLAVLLPSKSSRSSTCAPAFTKASV